ncbi:MAG: ABC transporter ATP-binding protein, partial [Enterocloster sp.]|nr:ABC transporter ATP-binding protein [Enterocloster sp.]
DEYSKWTIAYTKSMRPPMLRFTTAINAIFAIIIAFGIAVGASARTPQLILNLIFYTIITPVITTTLNKVIYAGENEMLVTDCLSRIQQIMDIKPLPEPEKAETPSDYSITLDHVSFSYAGADKKALNDISFTIESGEHVALVGPSGGGKSTIASLIPRFWDVESGRILIGGVDVRNIPKETLSDMVSFVFQDSSLLKMSVFDNVRLSHPDATREEVLQALHEAQCDDIIEKLPNGIDTVVGAAGVYVSGGEKQRLNIARVMLKNAPILILDEATAFADPDNETKVQAAFANMSRGKTVLMIAHRLSTVTDTSRIFVIKDGQVEESGNHKDLTASNGLYHRMWKDYCTNVGTFGPESAVRLHSDRGNLPYSNAKPRQIPFLDMQRMDSNDILNDCLVESR